MKTTKIKRDDLLERLKENRATHEKEFKSAKKAWLKKAIKELRKVADKAEKSQRLNGKSFNPLMELPKPVSYLDSYDTMIARLEVEVEETVELDEREFASYWLDDWAWKGQFVGTTSIYNNHN